VGPLAFRDPILARASLDASSVLLAMAKAPVERRSSVLRAQLDALQPGLGPEVARRMRQASRGRSPDQLLFDAIRTTLADRVVDRGVQQIRNRVGNRLGWDALLDTPLGLGQWAPADRATACTVAAGANVVGSGAQLIPVYGQIVGGIMSIGSSVASGALDCTREQREAQARQAAVDAAETRRQLDAATAMSQRTQASRQKMFLVGGGILGTAALLYLILS
jgi:hypothetical protein